MSTAETQSDGALVTAYKTRRDQSAFTELVRRYEKRLTCVLMRMVGDEGLAEELCQRSLVKAALSISRLSDGQAFYGWLLRIARNTALDELKRYAYRNQDPLERCEVLAEYNPSRRCNQAARERAQTAPENHHVNHAVRTVLRRMTQGDRTAVLMADLEQRSIEEIGALLGTKTSATKMRICRARGQFRTIYEEVTRAYA